MEAKVEVRRRGRPSKAISGIDPEDKLVCEKFQQVLQVKNISQEVAAEILKTKQNTVSRLITGKNAPSLSLLRRILIAFDINPNWFILNLDEQMFIKRKGTKGEMIDTKLIKNFIQNITSELEQLKQTVKS